MKRGVILVVILVLLAAAAPVVLAQETTPPPPVQLPATAGEGVLALVAGFRYWQGW